MTATGLNIKTTYLEGDNGFLCGLWFYTFQFADVFIITCRGLCFWYNSRLCIYKYPSRRTHVVDVEVSKQRRNIAFIELPRCVMKTVSHVFTIIVFHFSFFYIKRDLSRYWWRWKRVSRVFTNLRPKLRPELCHAVGICLLKFASEIAWRIAKLCQNAT